MQQVKQLLETKGGTVATIGPDAPVLDAIRLMAERRIGALVVVRDDALAGIVTERDYARKVILKGHSSRGTPVADIMTPAPTRLRSPPRWTNACACARNCACGTCQ